ncbi:MAG: hypothetical protein J6K82_02570, partial [Alphaproteobacteria bacterium]|nr:hypothetical protein [Alphaproteobacteria bacterium]
QCHVIVKIPDESGGLCFSIGVSENYEDWMHSTPDETTGFPTTGNYKSSWPRLTRCDATWVLGHDRYRVVINNDDVKIPESGYELLEWNIEQPYFYTGTNTNQYHLSDPVEFENFGQTGENITCKKQQFPNLDTWIKAIEEQNPDYCFLGVGTTPNPSNGAKLFWNTHGAPCVVAPSYTTKPAGQGKNLYEDVYMWWGTRSVGGCSQTYECTDANKPDEYLSFKDYPVCEE